MSRIRSSKSNAELVIVYEINPCVWHREDASPSPSGRLVLIRDRRQLFFFARGASAADDNVMEVVHLEDIAYVKLGDEGRRLSVYTNSELLVFGASDANRIRQMSARLKGELPCSQLRNWIASGANVRYGHRNSSLQRGVSMDRSTRPDEKVQLRRRIEAMGADTENSSPPAAPTTTAATTTTNSSSSSNKDNKDNASEGSQGSKHKMCERCGQARAKARVATGGQKVLCCRACVDELKKAKEAKRSKK